MIAFLAADGGAARLGLFAPGHDAFREAYPFLVTPSLKPGSVKAYPAELVPGALYLGGWEHAAAGDRLAELGITSLYTLHNAPDTLPTPACVRTHVRAQVADVESADISAHFGPAYDLIEATRAAGGATLVHCGAGASRSAAVAIAYLMRKYRMPADKARAHAVARRSAVNPNTGFWRALCALEAGLGLTQRSDPGDTAGGAGADAEGGERTLPVLAAGAAGERAVVVREALGGKGEGRPDGGSGGRDFIVHRSVSL